MAQFRTKARAVELLGKGQIADLPTAISELWKNGYDAYADNLEAYLYMKGYLDYPEPVLVITDDGKGMDRADILDKWFVLGTDSKSRNEVDSPGQETLYKPARVKMGEKGIGRLAVAYLGPQMLLLTKKINHPLEAVFFDWRILENYDLFLTDINIPLKSITSTHDFESVFNSLKEEFLQNFRKQKLNDADPWKDQQDLKEKILNECKQLEIPSYFSKEVLEDLISNSTTSHGTKFVIFKPDQQIVDLRNFTKKDETEDYRDDISVNYTISSLVGLFNLFKTEDPAYKTKFWIIESNNTGKYDLLKSRSFFSPEDFKDCDHTISGEFDEFGDFKGKVRIYKKEVEHFFKPIRKRNTTNYGPFKIKLGYVQSERDESILNEERKRVFENKLTTYSGLFIYRDGFRVLPYGRPDTDFLEFEERRSRSAGDYFFSKRRMFGYIEITRLENGKLIDKSSREGFINNAAYRDFKIDMISFFKDLAKKYFATRAEYNYKEEQKKEIEKLADAAKQEHEKDKEARREFARKLKDLPKDLDLLKANYDALISELESKIKQNNITYTEIGSIFNNIESCKVKILDLKLAKPARFKPSDLQKLNFHRYNTKYQSVLDHFEQASALLNGVRESLAINELFKEFESLYELYKNRLKDQFADFHIRLKNIFETFGSKLDLEDKEFTSDIEDKYLAIVPINGDAKQIAHSKKLLENIFIESQERLSNRVNPFMEHLERLSFDVNEDNLVGFYKIKFQEIKDEWNKTYELAQLGIAVEIIDHQFNTLYSQLEENVKSLQNFLLPNKDALTKYKNLDIAFDHLLDNYKLLQPLYRTTGRIRKELSGLELKEYIESFFRTRLIGNNIKIEITQAGRNWKVFSYESIFKPVLINIINNAIYWLQPVQEKKIKFDFIDGKLLIMNSGEKIDDYLLEDIFKLFVSNRPKGRGIGLYLAKVSLNGIGFEIEATNDPKYNLLNGACFAIYELNN